MCSAPFRQYVRRDDVKRSHSEGKFAVWFLFLKQYPLRTWQHVELPDAEAATVPEELLHTDLLCFHFNLQQSAAWMRLLPRNPLILIQDLNFSGLLLQIEQASNRNVASLVSDKSAAKTANFILILDHLKRSLGDISQ